jgi:cytochrome c oxidase assembly protein subunit 15
MTRPLARLAWTAALATYVLIVLGGIVRITGSGLGCGDDWPVCHGRLIPSFAALTTRIEWSHRLVAAMVSVLIVSLAGLTWWQRRKGVVRGEWYVPGWGGYVALGLLVVQVLLGAVTVRLHLPPWTIILHLGTAMLLLATLIVTARGWSRIQTSGLVAALLGFVTVLLGALTANLGAATACIGFPLCNGQWIPDGNYLQHVQWTHRLLAYTTYGYLLVWTLATRRRGPAIALGLATVQVGIAAAMVSLGLPPLLQAAHVAAGAALWGALVLAALTPSP